MARNFEVGDHKVSLAPNRIIGVNRKSTTPKVFRLRHLASSILDDSTNGISSLRDPWKRCTVLRAAKCFGIVESITKWSMWSTVIVFRQMLIVNRCCLLSKSARDRSIYKSNFVVVSLIKISQSLLVVMSYTSFERICRTTPRSADVDSLWFIVGKCLNTRSSKRNRRTAGFNRKTRR